MSRKLSSILLMLALVLSSTLVFAADSSWSGVISDSHCGAMHNKASQKASDCVEKCVKGGNQYVLVNSQDGKVYKLDPQDQAKGHGGHEVTVSGSLDGDTIHVTSITMAAKSGQ
ncbi:MAG: DUF5818 domain-containing protein [Acidobacteriia bacterium]|nr:DUF5818 domain-containing protein [Terriglobia bacterium]